MTQKTSSSVGGRWRVGAPVLLQRVGAPVLLQRVGAPVLLSCASAVALLSCVSAPVPEAKRLDAGAPPQVLDVGVYDSRGEPWPLEGAPRRPLVRLHLEDDTIEVTDETLLLLKTRPTPELLEDLEKRPLRTEHLNLAVPVRLRSGLGAAEIVPLQPLELGQCYTIGLAQWATVRRGRSLDEPFLRELCTAERDAGAVLAATWPANATSGVPTSLRRVLVRFDDETAGLEGGLQIQSDDGETIPARVASIECSQIGWPNGSCSAIALLATLQPLTTYRIRVSKRVLDRTGASVGPVSTWFITGSAEEALEARLVPQPCALDEEVTDVGCLLLLDRSAELRVQGSSPLRFFLESGKAHAAAVAPRGLATLVLSDLAPETAHTATLLAVDLRESAVSHQFTFLTQPPLVPLTITEVRADPRGPEPDQEYVEVSNWGERAVSLQGFYLTDRPDRLGDRIEAEVLLPPLGYALIVPSGFNPDEPLDAPVPPGVPLVRLDSTLGSGGLSNRGEAVYLRDREGRRISTAPATPEPRPGVCLVRTSRDGRTGASGTFVYDSMGTCTPGFDRRNDEP